MATIKHIDQTMRDGQQSYWGMRLHARQMLAIAEQVEAAGYHAVDIAGSSHFEVQVRFEHEDPWAGLDAIRAAMPTTTLRAGMRVNGAVGMGISPDALMELWLSTLGRHGIGSIWLLDCLHDIDKLIEVARMARSHGVAPSPQLQFAQSPVHTDEYYVGVARALAAEPAIESIILGDESGVLSVERAHTWIPALVEAAGDKPVELHFHNSTGLGSVNYLIGVEAGARIVHTCAQSLANGPSMPSTEVSVDNLRRAGHEVALDPAHLPAMSEHFAGIARMRGWPVGAPVEYQLSVVQSQFPGGMMGTLRDQLRRVDMEDRLPEVLEESIQVREEMGWPIMATPFSQLVGIQALINVVNGERYSTIPEENLQYLAGWYGPPPGPVASWLLDRALSSDRGRRIADSGPAQPSLAEIRAGFPPGTTDEDLVLRSLINTNDVEAMYAARRPIVPIVPGRHGLDWIDDLLAGDTGRHVSVSMNGVGVELRR